MDVHLSIIIPCFNSEATLEETLRSILSQNYYNWEALIVDDGSKDNTSKIAQNFIQKDRRFKYWYKSNEGLGKARNFGISKSTGEFILPLDSDNLVTKDYALTAIEVLKENPEIGVVHGNAELFGEESGIWEIRNFDFEQLLVQNYIDACAIFRKKLWEQVGGYDELMPYQGNEDWDLWLAFGAANVKFYHLNTVTFKYRIQSTSMNRSYTEEIKSANEDYIAKKYSKYYYHYFKQYRKKLIQIDSSIPHQNSLRRIMKRLIR